MTYDTIIRGGLWFDGTGAEPAVRDLGIRDGRVAVQIIGPIVLGTLEDTIASVIASEA